MKVEVKVKLQNLISQDFGDWIANKWEQVQRI